MLMEELFFEIGIVLVIAATMSIIVYRFKLPLVIAYIVTGLVAGPSLLSITHNSQVFQVMSQIGVAFLLFTVGLGLNYKNVKDVGGISLITGIAQVVFTTAIGFGLGWVLGFSVLTSIYLAIAFTFASTIIVVKCLTDKEDSDALYGRISIGFLLVQDFFAMVILLGLNAFKGNASVSEVFLISLLKAVIVIPILWFISSKILPSILSYVAKSQELLFLFAVGWCFFIAGILYYFGFGIEIGSLIAGVTLSGSVFHREINARIRPLRDFFLIIFFIALGTQLGFTGLLHLIVPIIVFVAFILIGNPLIVMFIMRFLGYHPRTGFMAGTTVAQISEFSFIIIAAGVSFGHLDNSVLGIVTIVGLLTIAISVLMIEHNEKIYSFIQPTLRWLEPEIILDEEMKIKNHPTNILLLGVHRTGMMLLSSIQKMKQSFAVVDCDPKVVEKLSKKKIKVFYGDAGDENFLNDIRAEKSKLIISTIPDMSVSTSILEYLKNEKYSGVIVVSVHTDEESKKCYELGATYVIVPNELCGKKLSEILAKSKTKKQLWKGLCQKRFVVN